MTNIGGTAECFIYVAISCKTSIASSSLVCVRLSACFEFSVRPFLCPGIDELLAQHIAHLFIRDPISLFGEKLQQDVETETDHFEVSSVDYRLWTLQGSRCVI